MTMFSTRFSAAVCSALIAAGGLSACAPLVVGGAAVATSVAIDRRTAGAQLDDQAIQIKVRTALNEHLPAPHHISINSYNRQVLLTGEVASEAMRAQATELARQADNVRAVFNETVIAPPSSFSERANDTWITSQIRSQLLLADDLPSKSLQITTERGTVYLQGLVTQREAQRVTELVRAVSGVEKVVRLFEYISEEELNKTLAEREARNVPMPPMGEQSL
ncbi:hypothetical protein AAV94_00925 [Lampropedia cohaerens]|uniref:BON domain-containing protein n=2 Tax=Lampropedia cohaerens TaxID=1610491 RepID=A0A0U1Q2N9_9BURK|nr:hypothetical protein AAV94_00925 [Lampropedia cohaerens]